jgi:2-succinyl-6-hydroxy-2,4-cyclohexadiene-1-carboxylate synthase
VAPALVLLHGFTQTGASWSGVLAALRESYRALAPDLRGHGSASDLEPVTLEAVIGDIGDAAPERFTLVGYSMGGRIALHVALVLPERVERLVLIGASPGLSDPAERQARAEADAGLAAALESSTIEAFAERWAELSLLADQPPHVRAAAHQDRLRNRPESLARALRGLGTGALPSLWNRLGRIRVPVALVVGERDIKFREIAYAMARELRQPQLHVVPGTGHAVHLEAPETVAGIIAHPPR